MAFVEKHGSHFRVVFRYNNKRFTHTLQTSDQDVADGILGGVKKTLMLLKQHVLHLSEGVDVLAFILSGGKVHEPTRTLPEATPVAQSNETVPVSLEQFHSRYIETLKVGSIEENSLETVNMHLRHFVRTLGADFLLSSLTLTTLQGHITTRAKDRGIRGRLLSPTTMKKEIASLRAAWNWGVQSGLLTGTFPTRGLKYPKTTEKPPFLTWAEIERRIHQGELSETEQQDLWDCVFLQLPETDELLQHVKEHAHLPWLYPMFVFAAHTGARRSEMIRAKRMDLDLEDGTVRIQEKKRAHGKRTTRRVPLSPFLVQVLREWLMVHPGGPFLFAQSGFVFRSKKRSRTTGHLNDKARPTTKTGRMAGVKVRELPDPTSITQDEAHDHFKRTLAGSKWKVLRGWHCLRHSFISNCVAQKVDQRMLDQWVGHTTEEMRRRYLHLIPSDEQATIGRVFAKV